jgi:hypothetical protein
LIPLAKAKGGLRVGSSVSSYQIYLNHVLIAWRWKSQKTVALSSSEAEFCACGEAVREIPFIAQILMSMNIPVELPMQLYMDNVGAIFMPENQTSSSRTRQIDTRWWYVNDLQSQGLIKINFIPMKENVSDLGTKNVTKEV